MPHGGPAVGGPAWSRWIGGRQVIGLGYRRGCEGATLVQRAWRGVAAAVPVAMLAACASPHVASGGPAMASARDAIASAAERVPAPAMLSPAPPALPMPIPAAQVIDPGRPLQCVVYVEQVTGIDLRGDAWRWWGAAAGRYPRGHTPEEGAILVFRRRGTMLGHVAIVTRVLSDRLILASHANWLNHGMIYENTPIEDVSARGDWSAVRVWYVPGNQWGGTPYPTYGFIYDRPMLASE